VAAQISTQLFGGVRFVETREGDEVPGVRLERDVLGFSPRIYGESPEFVLKLATTISVCDPEDFPQLEIIHLDKYMEERLALIEGITVLPT
jgi:hypothetical protein